MLSVSRSHAGVQRALCIVDPTLTGAGGHSLAVMVTSFDLVEIFANRACCVESVAAALPSPKHDISGIRKHFVKMVHQIN